VIDLEQLKDRYYEPGLLSKIMGFTPGGLRPVDELKNVALHPQITQASITGDRLHVELEARSGGIGKVALLLDDNIELDTNANPGFQATFDVDLQRFAGHFYPDSINHLSLRTYNHDGWLKGQPYQLEYRPTPSPTTLLSRREQQLDSINLYALVVGTSHFRGQQLNLQYPDQDATAFAEALRLAGKPLFGKNINVQLLTTAAEPWPRKVVIAKAMRDIAAQADPNDILLVYFSGHGITYPPNSEKGQFYYLTTDIGSDKLDDPAVLAGLAIAQDTLQEWIRQIKARKRILILDACNSGRVVERLEPGAKELNSDQRRALEQMKDRSGMFVLAGSAADKSSFEASRYGHGLLTYSLLNNMPIVATANKHFILVDKLFGLVREEVPRLAKGIGKVQDPELIGGESYAIGLINESVRIVVPEAKPVFVRTVFIDSDKSKDLLHLSTAVNDYLERRATEKDPAIAYWPVEEFNGDHYYLGGQYRQAGETVSGKATLYREDKELASFPFSGDRNGLGGLAEGILGLVFGYLNSHRD
ncbi:MAG: caspase family protein, partial [Saprospiraceae bacterium]